LGLLGKIYDARSRYLHDGEPMFISRFMDIATDWHFDPSVGITMDKRSVGAINVDQKNFNSLKLPYQLPYPYWFENLVNYCLKTYLAKCIQKR
jgi:hypothetical protein